MPNHMDPDAKAMLRKFSYEKVRVPSKAKSGQKAGLMVIAWEIRYEGIYMEQVNTLTEVKQYIKDKVDN